MAHAEKRERSHPFPLSVLSTASQGKVHGKIRRGRNRLALDRSLKELREGVVILPRFFPCGKQEKAEWNEEEECALRKEKEDIAIRMTAWELAPRQHETTSHGQGCTLEAFQKCSDEDRSHAEAREDSRGSVAFPSKYPYRKGK